MALNLAQALDSGGLTIDQGQDAQAVAPLIGDPSPSGGGGGGGSTGGSTYVAPDPYAQWGGEAKYNQLVSGFNNQKSNIFDTAYEAADAGASGLKTSILDFIDMYKSGQSKIDLAGVNNELAKRQGVAGVRGMVGRGIRSGGVVLANKNASDSSAAGAIARAYADIGGREMRGIGNQYETGNREIGLQQQDLEAQGNRFARNYEQEKVDTVNAITTEARNKLAALDAEMLDAELPDRIAINQEKAKIKAEALERLSKYDQLLRDKRSAIKAITPEERARQALEAQNAGRDLGEGAFDFTEQVPAQFQGGGPFASDLPIFTRPRTRQEV